MPDFFYLILFTCYASFVFSAKPDRSIFILAGQSNMSGRGGISNGTWDGVVPSQCRPNSAIQRLDAELKWVKAVEPLHKDIDINATCGVGPGMAFAHSVLNRNSTSAVVGLVPCAVGGFRGTKISEWARGTFLYNNLVRRAGAATKGGGKIRALLWYQGESDTVNLEDSQMYSRRLKRFFVDLRKDLKSPNLLIIQVNGSKFLSIKTWCFTVALASEQGTYIEKVREAQLGLNLKNVICVDAKRLELEPDHLHLCTNAEVQLGKMLANAYAETKTS